MPSQALEELARKKFELGHTEIEFYSSCMNLCNDHLARIDDDVWEHVTPYIGCVSVARKLSPNSFSEGTSYESHFPVACLTLIFLARARILVRYRRFVLYHA